MTMTISGTDGLTFPDSTAQYSGSYFSFKNRIINGDMRIDQRNAGAAVTTSSAYPVDRFSVPNGTDGAFSAQQDTSAPTGFVNSLKITITTADASLGATQYLAARTKIEGTNISDLAWGSANAKTVTFSFWVRSSLTGTFGGALLNAAQDRSYPFSYTISSANTWEQKSITISGDTTGTWLTTTGTGIDIFFGLGVGSTYSGTAGAWAATTYLSATGATSVVGTLNATWYITGVQLEVGSTATPFERRPYGTELMLCQRYYEKHSSATSNNYTGFAFCTAVSTGDAEGYVSYLVTKRSAPTISGATLALSDGVNAVVAVTNVQAGYRGTESALISVSVASGLTQYRPYNLISNNSASGNVAFSSEL